MSRPWQGTLKNVPEGSGRLEVLMCKGLHEEMIK